MNIYEKALAVLDESGWHQGGSSGPDGGMCISFALWKASGEAPGSKVAFLWRLIGRFGLGCNHVHSQLWEWNDCPNTTEEDVRLLLKHAAAEVGE